MTHSNYLLGIDKNREYYTRGFSVSLPCNTSLAITSEFMELSESDPDNYP